MSVTVNPLSTNYDVSQVFLGRNRYKNYTYTNSTGSTVTLVPGTLLGLILATNLLLPHISSATDGSEQPIGVCADTYVVPTGTSVLVTLCNRGEVNQNKVVLGAGDTMATVVRTVSTGGGTIEQLILKNTDIELVPSIELTIQDPNQ